MLNMYNDKDHNFEHRRYYKILFNMDMSQKQVLN